MLKLIAAVVFLALNTPVQAEIIRIDTAGGPVSVSREIASRMKAFIADVVERGFKGHIGCFARGGHVSGSRHYSGNACDFAQTGWGKTVKVMYHVGDLAKKHGLRDGCSFGDCGHIDDGRQLARGRGIRYAKSGYVQEATAHVSY